MEKIGKDCYGRQWNRFDRAKKMKKAYEAVSEEELCKDGLKASNFNAFVKVLGYCIGNEANQTMLIQKQVSLIHMCLPCLY